MAVQKFDGISPVKLFLSMRMMSVGETENDSEHWPQELNSHKKNLRSLTQLVQENIVIRNRAGQEVVVHQQQVCALQGSVIRSVVAVVRNKLRKMK